MALTRNAMKWWQNQANTFGADRPKWQNFCLQIALHVGKSSWSSITEQDIDKYYANVISGIQDRREPLV